MYKVLLVDDELLVRIGLKSMIDWEGLGFQIVGEAGSGEAAYEKYIALKPDVLITDIEMPRKDGLWLIRQIRKQDTAIEIIILTCHEQFDYVREAMTLSVSDYILKAEMEEAEIVEMMLVKKKILDQRASSSIGSTSDTQLVTTTQIHNHLFGLLIKNTHSVEYVAEKFEQFGYAVHDKKYCFLIMDFDTYLKDHMDKQRTFADVLASIMQIVIGRFNHVDIQCIAKQFGKTITYFLLAKHLDQHALSKLSDDLKQCILDYFHVKYKSTNTDICSTVLEVREHIDQLYYASDLLFYCELDQHLVPANTCVSHAQGKLDISTIYTKVICDHLESGNIDGTMLTLQQIKHQLCRHYNSPTNTKLMLIHFIDDIIKQCNLYIDNGHEAFLDFQKDLLEAADMNESMDIILDFITLMQQYIHESNVDNADLLIQKAIRYMEEHYHQKIYLEDVAKTIGISKYYLSNLFKKVKGVNFSAYLNEYRVEQAKVLLKNPSLSTAEISERVGFGEPKYLSKLFKKYTGETISEHRSAKKKMMP